MLFLIFGEFFLSLAILNWMRYSGGEEVVIFYSRIEGGGKGNLKFQKFRERTRFFGTPVISR